jgi:hypothetical protein
MPPAGLPNQSRIPLRAALASLNRKKWRRQRQFLAMSASAILVSLKGKNLAPKVFHVVSCILARSGSGLFFAQNNGAGEHGLHWFFSILG